MRRWIASTLILLAAIPSLDAQGTALPAPRTLSVAPASELHPGDLTSGNESPNGRFVVGSGSTAGDSGIVRYDRKTRSWAPLIRTPFGYNAQWSPDGRFLSYSYPVEGKRGLFVWVVPVDSATGLTRGTPRRVSTRTAVSPTWSPDGRRIGFASDDSSGVSLVVIPFNGGEEEVLYHAPGRAIDGKVVWSPDGRLVYLAIWPPHQAPAQLVRVDVATRVVERHEGGLGLFGISRDGKWLGLFSRHVPYLSIASAQDARVLERYYVPPGVVPIGWSRSTANELLAWNHIIPTTVQRASLPEGTLRALTPMDSFVIDNTAYSPDGKSIAYARLRGGASQLVVIDADGSNPRYLGEAGGVASISWSPSGREIAYLSDRSTTLRTVDVVSGKDREVARNVIEPMQQISWRTDGSAIRYSHLRQTPAGVVRDLHEISRNGKDRLVWSVIPGERPTFVNDSLLVVIAPEGLKAVNLRTRESRVLYSGSVRGGNVSVSTDGNWLALVANGQDDVPLLVSLKTGESRKIPYRIGGEVLNSYFLPDGKTLAVSACPTCNTGIEKWHVVLVPINGDPPRVLTAGKEFADTERPSISPDGKSLVFYLESAYYTRLATITLPTVTSEAASADRR